MLGTYNTFVKFTVPLSLGVSKSKAYKGRGLTSRSQVGWKGTPAKWRVPLIRATATPLLPEGTMHKRWSWLQLPDPHIIQVTRILDFFFSCQSDF